VSSPAINIGVAKETIQAARAALLDIIKASGVSDAVKIEALQTLTKLCACNNTSISHCNFTTK